MTDVPPEYRRCPNCGIVSNDKAETVIFKNKWRCNNDSCGVDEFEEPVYLEE